MTWKDPPKFIPAKPKAGKKLTPEMLAKCGTEDGHQAAVFCWAADSVSMYPQLAWLFAIPNGGSKASIVEATRFVATGLRKGVPDIFLPAVAMAQNYKTYAGCSIEMKIEAKRNAKDGGLSKDQLIWIPALREAGYYVTVCYNWMEAREVLINYLEGKL